jgi:ribose transport system ATP-binding protein
MTGAGTRSVLEVRCLSKTFPGQRALDEVDLSVEGGEIHALLGQNGSGKSTLIKVLAGYHAPDPGASIHVDGERLRTGVPGAGHELGLRFVHQDLGLVPTLNVIDNLALSRGYRTSKVGRIRWTAEAARAAVATADIGLDVDPFAPVASLSLAQRACLAVARAVHDDERATKILVLDEPTAALPADEVEHLFGVLRRLRDRGVAILLVSHHLDEVLAIADRVTVLRDGRHTATVARAGLGHDELVELIVGRTVQAAAPRPPLAAEGRTVCLRAHGVSGGGVREISLEVARGEVVGLAGLDGSGRESVIPLLTGQDRRDAGTVEVGSRPVASASPAGALRAGMAFVPAERGRLGVFAAMTLRENLTIGRLHDLRRFGRIRRTAERTDAADWIEQLQIVAPGTEAPVAALSGGNQQKVVLGRSLRLRPSVLLLDEPTQGVDVGARNEVHRIIEQAVADGMAVLVASTDSDELVRLCDRVLILQGGLVVRTLHRDHDLTVDEVDHAQMSRVAGDLERDLERTPR